MTPSASSFDGYLYVSRCHYALQRVLETRKLQAQLDNELIGGDVMV